MKTKFLTFIILSLLLAIGTSGCSNDEPDPEKYYTSLLTGEYGKDGAWELYVTKNGTSANNYGYVRFESKSLETADFIFTDVIPGEAKKEFKDIPLTETEKGFVFRIEITQKRTSMEITGIVSLGVMRIDLKTK